MGALVGLRPESRLEMAPELVMYFSDKIRRRNMPAWGWENEL